MDETCDRCGEPCETLTPTEDFDNRHVLVCDACYEELWD